MIELSSGPGALLLSRQSGFKHKSFEVGTRNGYMKVGELLKTFSETVSNR